MPKVTKIYSVDGKIVESLKSNEVYLALFKRDGYWTVSGVIYRRVDDIGPNLYGFKADAILIVKVEILKEFPDA